MDFSQFNTRSGADEGRFLHLKHLMTGELLYDVVDGKKEPVGITLRGLESELVQEAIQKANRARVSGKDTEEQDAAAAQAMVISFHNITRNGEPLTTSREDVKWFFDQSSKLVRAALSFAGEPGNFLPATRKD